jgi:hypothetical protein
MWTKGIINGYDYCIKHFEEGSEYGINGGRISKLDIRQESKILASYDRGWDIKPTGKEVIAVFEEILNQYN